MFKTLYQYTQVLLRHAKEPLAKERSTFLSHLAQRGTPRSTLLRYARQLRIPVRCTCSVPAWISTPRAWLGHAHLRTTNIYAESDLDMKAKALAICEAPLQQIGRKRSVRKGIMGFLSVL